MLLSPKPGAILCQTVDSHFTLRPCHVSDTSRSFEAFRLHSNSPHKLCPSTFWTSLFCAPLVLESVGVWRTVQLSPTTHKGLCYFVSVFPSFTYLTAAVLSFVVFPFTLLSSASTPSRTMDHLDSRPQWPSDQHVCVDFDRFDCDEAVFHYGWRYHARQGQKIKLLHVSLNLNIFNGHNG